MRTPAFHAWVRPAKPSAESVARTAGNRSRYYGALSRRATSQRRRISCSAAHMWAITARPVAIIGDENAGCAPVSAREDAPWQAI